MNLTKFSSLLGAVMVLAGAGQLQAQTLTGQSSDPAGWSTVWYDDFTGSVLDGTKWNIETNTSGGGNNELQYYGPEGVSVSGGNLVLTASREARSGKAFTSGRINSRGKVYFTHGKLEARIKLPKTAKGLWPAFWMLGENIGTNPWPQCGEIDILEMGHKDGWNGTNDPEKYMNGACHWGYYENGGYPSYAKAGNAPYSVQDGEYHLFTCVWDKEKISMYLDNATTPYYEMNISSVATDKDPGNYFHKNFHILFNVAVGGSFPGIFEANGITATLPAQMLVDWVRISQPQGDSDYTFNKADVGEEDQDVYPEDPDTKPGLWGKKALDDNGQFTFDINNASDVVLIATSQGVTDSFNGKIRANYNVDNSKNFFYIWENTYTAVSTKGVNSFGFSEAYTALEVGTKGWSGAGYASSAGNGKDLSMLADDSYVLHFSMKGADLNAHRTHTITVGNVEFNIGRSGSGVTLGDYPRDGQWYSFDIPLKVLRSINPTLFDNASSFEGNVFAVKSGGFGGTRIQFDNVFFYKSAAPIVDVPTTDTETVIGRYASKALENNTSTFDFTNGYEYVPVMASPAALDAMSGKIKLNLNAGGGNADFYNWKQGDNLTYDQMEATGTNSMGEEGNYTALSVGAQGWSGAAVMLSSAKDISFLTDDANKYWLHFAMKGNDILMHANQTIGIGKAKFVIGNASTAVGDYRRDGEWYAFDIPVSALKVISDPLFDNASAFSDNIFTISTGGTKNAQVQFDNVFFYRNDTKNADDITDNTPCGNYVSKAIVNNAATFDFSNAADIIPIEISASVRNSMNGKIRSGYDTTDSGMVFNIWEQTLEEAGGTGNNSFNAAEEFKSLKVTSKNWSGSGYEVKNALDLSVLSSEENYYLHFAIRDKDYMSHQAYKFGVGSATLTLGKEGDGYITDFTRNGEWYYIDIPVSKLTGHNLGTGFTGNIFTANAGTRAGALLEIDNVFFYKNLNPQEPSVDPTPSMTVKIAAGATSCKPNEKITFTVTPTYKNCTISKVQVKVGETAYDATEADGKYTYEWTAPAAGSYSVKAVVTTTDNRTYESSAITVTVAEEAAPSMTVAIAASASSCKKDEKVTFTVTPTYQNCTISKVQVKVGDNAYDATVANDKYTYEWTAPAAGSYSVKAVVTTTDNETYESSAITVTVTEETVVDPDPSTGEKIINFTAAQASDGTLYGDGYLKYSWDGTYVTVTAHFNNPENYPGGNLGLAYFWDETNGFNEKQMTTVSNGEFTFKLEGYKVGDKVKGRVKIAFEGGMAVTPMTEYTIDGTTVDPDPVKYTYKGITDTANVKCYDTHVEIPYRVVKIDSNKVETVLTQEEATALNLKVFYAWNGNDDAQKAQALTTPTGTYSCTGLTTGTDYAFYEKFYITVDGNETQIDGKDNFHFTAKTPEGEVDPDNPSLDNDVEVLLTTGLITPVDYNKGTFDDANKEFIPTKPTEDGAIYWEKLVKGKVEGYEEYQFFNLHMYYWAEHLSTGQLRFTFTYVDVDNGYKPVGLVPAVHFFDSETDEPMNELNLNLYDNNEPLRCPETFEPWPTTGPQASAPARVISYNNNAEIERQMTELGYKTTRVETVDAYEKPSVKYQFNMQFSTGGLIRSNIQKIDNIETGVNVIEAENGVYVRDGKIIAPEGSMIFDMQGQRMNADNALQHGIYIVVSGRTAVKVLVK